MPKEVSVDPSLYPSRAALDTSAYWSWFVRCHSGAIRTWIKQSAIPPHLRDDAYQECLLVLYRARDRYDVRKRVPFTGYAHRIVHNHLISLLRQRHWSFEERHAPLPKQPAPRSDDDKDDWADLDRRLRSFIAELKTHPDFGPVYKTVYEDGLTIRAAARRLGLSPTTVQHRKNDLIAAGKAWFSNPAAR
jgi:RNA polymerase sigma factor (sigma-70 family)